MLCLWKITFAKSNKATLHNSRIQLKKGMSNNTGFFHESEALNVLLTADVTKFCKDWEKKNGIKLNKNCMHFEN